MKPLCIFGAGGHGKVVLDAACAMGLTVDFLVDDVPAAATLNGVPVMATHQADWQAQAVFEFLVAVGDNANRASLYRELLAKGGVPINVIHPRAVISPRAALGKGVFVAAGVVVNPEARIGDNVILNTSCSVDHDCVVGDHVHLCPGVRLAGEVNVGALTLVGTGACILPRVRIGERSVIGAGSVVNRDIPPGVVAYGVPARIHRKNTCSQVTSEVGVVRTG
jgi:sugar O-acyltransferase (sialic acid O-acetyltransferase NeuD family)